MKHSVCALADADFYRMGSDAIDDIAKVSQAIADMKTEMKRRGIHF